MKSFSAKCWISYTYACKHLTVYVLCGLAWKGVDGFGVWGRWCFEIDGFGVIVILKGILDWIFTKLGVWKVFWRRCFVLWTFRTFDSNLALTWHLASICLLRHSITISRHQISHTLPMDLITNAYRAEHRILERLIFRNHSTRYLILTCWKFLALL